MEPKLKKMILEWLEKDGGDIERLARWMAYRVHIGGIKICRALIREAKGK